MIRIEKLEDCLEEMKPILKKHYKEVYLYADKIDLNPDYDSYYLCEKAGLLDTVIAREEGRIVGYFLSFIFKNPHYKDHYFAVNDIIYVEPTLRKTGVALDMVKFAEERLREKGVSVMTISMKANMPFENLCRGLGMDKSEYVYTKYIGE